MSDGSRVHNQWHTTVTSWVSRVLSGPADEDTCWLVNPTMDDIDAGFGIDDYLVSYGAWNGTDGEFVWINIPVFMQRPVYVSTVGVTNNIAQFFENQTAVNNAEAFFDNTGTYKVMYISENLFDIYTIVYDNAAKNGSLAGAVRVFWPQGGLPNDSMGVYIGGQLYYIERYSKNPVNTVVVDTTKNEKP
jgi:hypothetical protein